MSGVKHTPGPWFARRAGFSTVYIEARIGSGMLQEVAACGPTEVVGHQESNARLIAAAPELLELVKMVHESFGGGLVMTFSEADVESFSAAIAKATGEQS